MALDADKHERQSRRMVSAIIMSITNSAFVVYFRVKGRCLKLLQAGSQLFTAESSHPVQRRKRQITPSPSRGFRQVLGLYFVCNIHLATTPQG